MTTGPMPERQPADFARIALQGNADEAIVSAPWAPRGLARLLVAFGMALAAVMAWLVTSDREQSAGLPISIAFIYGMLALGLNRTHTRFNGDGILWGYGPLPCLPKRRVMWDRVHRVTYREPPTARAGAVHSCAVGMLLDNGVEVLVLDSIDSGQQAKALAHYLTEWRNQRMAATGLSPMPSACPSPPNARRDPVFLWRLCLVCFVFCAALLLSAFLSEM